MAAPSAQELAQLQTQIETEGVSAIFVGVSANAELSTQIAQELGIEVVPIYVDLSVPRMAQRRITLPSCATR